MERDQSGGHLSASTRGRIIALLRRSNRTVEEIAQELNVTDNAIRGHLARLESDGLVQQGGMRRGTSKPAYLYKLTPQAERLFPKAYAEVLAHLLEVLEQEQSPEQVEMLLRAAGRRLAMQHPIPTAGDLNIRLNAAVGVLNQLGGLMELEESDGSFYICGYSCPLSSVAYNDPQICKLVESMITELVGTAAHERCERSESLSCWFEVPAPAR